jgi:membrane protein
MSIQVRPLLKDTIQDFLDDKSFRLAAALSYYTTLSLAPLLLVVIGVAGFAVGTNVARNALLEQINALVGSTGGKQIAIMLQSAAARPAQGILSSVIGVVMLLFAATGVVVQLKDALNTIWEVKPDSKGGIKTLITERILSFAMILGIGFLLLVSLVISAFLSALNHFWGGDAVLFLQVINVFLSIVVITFLFAMIFKFLPDKKIKWRSVWFGAFFTAVLFTIGKTLTALYLANSSVASSYGAAGSLVIILLWVYYSSVLLFLGAEFTQVYTQSKAKRSLDMSLDNEKNNRLLDSDSERSPELSGAQRKHANLDRSLLTNVAHFSGYEAARIENSLKPVKESVEKKWRTSKWIYRLVNLLGFKRSAKLGWKGYKIKHRVEDLTESTESEK